MLILFIFPVNSIYRKCRNANTPVFAFCIKWIAVPHPAPGLYKNTPPGFHHNSFSIYFKLFFATAHERVFIKFGALKWFTPAWRGNHAGNAVCIFPCAGQPGMFFNQFTVGGGNHKGGSLFEIRHG